MVANALLEFRFLFLVRHDGFDFVPDYAQLRDAFGVDVHEDGVEASDESDASGHEVDLNHFYDLAKPIGAVGHVNQKHQLICEDCVVGVRSERPDSEKNESFRRFFSKIIRSVRFLLVDCVQIVCRPKPANLLQAYADIFAVHRQQVQFV